MEDFKDSFLHQLEQLIQNTLEGSDSLDPLERINAIAEVLTSSTAATIDAIGLQRKVTSIPNNRVAVLQIIPTDVFVSANKALDEICKEMKSHKQTTH